MKNGEIIKIDGEEKQVFICDRKAKCNKSRYCGKECKFTLDKKHAVFDEQQKTNVRSGNNAHDN